MINERSCPIFLAKRVLVISLSGIGNAIQTFPMIDELDKQGYVIDILTDSKQKIEVFKLNKNVNRVFIMHKDSLQKTLVMNKELFDQLKLNHYSKTITTFPHQGIYSAVLMKQLGGISRVQHRYHFKWFNNISWLLTESQPIIRKNVVELNMDLVNCKKKDIKYKKSNRLCSKTAMRIFDKKKLNVLIHPGCAKSMIWKRWNGWKDLCKRLSKHKNIKVHVLIGPEENILDYSYANTIECPFIISASMVGNCDLFVSADTGFAHLASMFGIKQITLFGGCDPVYTAPYSKKAKILTPKDHKIIHEPYQKKREQGYNQVDNIKVEEVYKEIVTNLANPKNI